MQSPRNRASPRECVSWGPGDPSRCLPAPSRKARKKRFDVQSTNRNRNSALAPRRSPSPPRRPPPRPPPRRPCRRSQERPPRRPPPQRRPRLGSRRRRLL